MLIWLDTRYDEARRHNQQAAALDPVDRWIPLQGVWTRIFGREFERAVEQARHLIVQEPLFGMGHYALGCTLVPVGRNAEAIVSLKRAMDLDVRGANAVGAIGMAYAVDGQRDRALECLRELDEYERDGRDVATWKAHVYAGLGHADRVIECLSQAVEQRSSSTIFTITAVYFDSMREDPRFIALLRRMGLERLATHRWPRAWKPPSHS